MTGADAAGGTPGIAEMAGIGIEETVATGIGTAETVMAETVATGIGMAVTVATGTGMTETVTAEAAREEGTEEDPMAPPQPKMGCSKV